MSFSALRNEGDVPAPAGPERTAAQWGGLARGLILTLSGEFLVLVGVLAGVFVVVVGTAGDAGHAAQPAFGPMSWGAHAGAFAVGLAVAVGFALLVVGQVRCLTNTLRGQAGRRLILAGLTTLVLGVLLSIGALVVWQTDLGEDLADGLYGLHMPEGLSADVLLLLPAGAGAAVSLFLVTQFLRGVAAGFDARSLVRRVDCYVILVCLLLGATFGASLFLDRLPFISQVRLGLAEAWLVALFIHLFLIGEAAACVGVNARRLSRRQAGPGGTGITIQSIPQKLSGMHRLLRNALREE